MLIDDLAGQSLDAKAIQAQLEQILASHHFCHSSRYPALLQYIVQQTLEGNAGKLKERLLGIEVFHRAPDYDTNAEPIVRVTAAEVRKRIAQYYHEAEHRGELRIELPTGSYVPRFVPAPVAMTLPTTDEVKIAVPAVTSMEPFVVEPVNSAYALPGRPAVARDGRVRSGPAKATVFAVIGALCLLLGAAGFLSKNRSVPQEETALREFWAPLATGPGPVLVVVGDGRAHV